MALTRGASVLLYGLASFILLVGWGYATAWRSLDPVRAPPDVPLPRQPLTSAEYGLVIDTHARPYTYEVGGASGTALIYGIEHTRDPNSPSLRALADAWDRFGPTAVLIEGRLGFLPPLVGDPVREFGESGFAYGRALDQGIPVASWEVPVESEVDAALGRHTPEQAWLFFVLRPYVGSVRHGVPDDPEQAISDVVKTRSAWPAFAALRLTTADVDRIWRRDFPSTDWRTESDQDGLPGYLHAIAEDVGLARDRHLVRVVADFAGRGHRVLVVAGSSHAVKIEPVLRAIWPAPR